MSGIASLLQQVTTSEYMAGLWQDTFVMDMLWQLYLWEPSHYSIRYDKVEHGESKPPTWSWASVDAHVIYDTSRLHLLTPLCSARDIKTSLTSPNPFGGVRGGIATLIGPCIQARVEIIASNHRSCVLFSQYTTGTGTFEMLADCGLRINRSDPCDPNSREVICRDSKKMMGTETWEQGGFSVTVNCLVLAQYPARKVSNHRGRPLYDSAGIVFEASRSKPDAFERLGYFSIENQTKDGWITHSEIRTIKIV
jgi:hypothetical protein